MSRILRHISAKDLKRTHQKKLSEQKKLAAQKLKEWQEAEAERKQIEEIARPFKSDWREETQLQESEWFSIPGSGPTNSASQSFQYGGEGGPTATFSGLGGVEAYPSTVDVDGETYNTPNYSQLGLQGYAKPLGSVQRQTQQSENERIDAEIRKLEEQIKESKAKETAAIDAWNAELRATMDRHGREWEAVLKKDGVYNPEKHKGLQARHDAEIEAVWNKEPKTKPYETERQNLRVKIAELEKQRPINQQLDASQEFAQNVGADYMMNARPMTTDMDKFMDAWSRRWGGTEGPNAPNAPAEGKWWMSMMRLMDSGMSYNDALRQVGPIAGQPSFNYDPSKTPFGADYGEVSQVIPGGGMIDPSAYGRVFNTTVPGVKNYKPGYVPYPNPNNYKPVSAGEKAYVRSLQTVPGLVNLVSTILGNDEGSAATPADWALQYARGDYTPITKSPGRAFNQNTMELISIALDSPNTPRGSVQTHTYNDRKTFDYIRDTSIRNSLGQFNYRVTPNGIEISDTFNFSGNTSIGALGVVDDIIGRATGGMVDRPIQRNADKLVDIGYRSALEKGQNPADDKHGIPIKYTIPWSEVPAKLQNKLDPNQRLVPIVRKRNRRGREKRVDG